MKILITGGLGFIGSNLIRFMNNLLEIQVVVFDNFSQWPEGRPLPQGITVVKGDVGHESDFKKLPKDFDIIFHFAGFTSVVQSFAQPNCAVTDNVIGTFNVLEFARENRIERVFCASTGGAIIGDFDGAMHEELNPKPLSIYGASKMAGEALGHAYTGAFGLKVVNLRFSNVFGPGSLHKGSAVALFFRQILNNEKIVIFGDGEQTRDFIYVQDLCEAIHKLVKNDCTGVYQIATGIETSINELLAKMSIVTGIPLEKSISKLPQRPGEVKHTKFLIEKLVNDTDFEATTSLEQGLSKTWSWFREEYSVLTD